MRIAFIVQRYGAEILGGSEYHCRLIAERMAERHDVEVLTTCARDYVTWKNEYTEGTDRVRGVTIRRFANAAARDIEAFNKYSDWIFAYPHTRDDEMEWLRRQGPWCPALIDYLERSHRSYDVLVFFTYLYAPTVLGLRVAPERSILVPTAHDEPAIRLSIYRELFGLPAAIAYNTATERQFLKDEFGVQARAEETIGCGVDLPSVTPPRASEARREQGDAPRRGHRDRDGGRGRAAPPPQVEPAAASTEDEEQEDALNTPRFRAGARGERFRRRHRIHGDIALYGGRIDPGKGCEELFEYFTSYREAGGTAALALMGVKLMAIPEAPYIRFAGQLSDEERTQALEAATVVIVPSPFESLSLLALEAFAVGTPILANGRSDVLVDHCRLSNAGLYYESRDEFVEALDLLMADARLRAAMGRNGRSYIQANYRWDVILQKYDRLVAAIRRG
ncbi:MAG: glycosyltransferase family 4 protein [Vicinamibacterales bacterium]|nr:glycosyltransferase family 4 protein [Vicinamibacterales bacterium]